MQLQANSSSDVQLSIVVPVLNDANALKELLLTLQNWKRQKAPSVELIVVDGGSQDDSQKVARALADRLIISKSGRARQMNAGAQLAKGCILWFLHADTQLSLSNLELFWEQLHKLLPNQEYWGFLPITFFKPSTHFEALALNVLAYCIFTRARVTGIATGDLSLWLSRSLFERCDGFPDQPLMEDLEITKKLSHQTKRPTGNVSRKLFPISIATSPRRWQTHGFVKTVVFMWKLRLLYFFGASVQSIASQYYPKHASQYIGCSEAAEATAKDLCLLMFTKRIQPGRVKTRMQPVLTPMQSAQLHKALLSYSLTNIRQVEADVQLWLTGPGDMPEHPYLELEQPEGDLGERMLFACDLALTQYKTVCLIGADCPYLDQEQLSTLQNRMTDTDCDCAVIPAIDGGFVALLTRVPLAPLFSNIDWGTDRVMAQLRRNADYFGVILAELGPLADIDRPEDLKKLAAFSQELANFSVL